MREVSCPQCGSACLFAPTNPFRPFCSDRCKRLDWGAWSLETYRLETAPPLDGGMTKASPSGPVTPALDYDE